MFPTHFDLDYIYEDPSNDADKQSGDATTTNLMDVSNEGTEKSTNRFKDVSVEDTDAFLHENINRNTAYKTKTDVKKITEWLQQYGEERDFHGISGSEMDSLLARFCLSVRKKDQSEFEPDSISSIFHSIDR